MLALAVLASTPLLAATPINQSRPLDPRGRVEIENLKGRIEVRAWDRPEVKIEGSLGAGVEKLEIEGDRQRLVIRVKYPNRGSGLGFLVGGDKTEPTELRLMVPLKADLEIESVAADVDVTGVAPEELSIDSVSGDVVVAAAPREASIDSVSGDLTLTLNRANVSVESVSGDVLLRGRLGNEVKVETVSGSIDSGRARYRGARVVGRDRVGRHAHRHRARRQRPDQPGIGQRQRRPEPAAQRVGKRARRELQRRPARHRMRTSSAPGTARARASSTATAAAAARFRSKRSRAMPGSSWISRCEGQGALAAANARAVVDRASGWSGTVAGHHPLLSAVGPALIEATSSHVAGLCAAMRTGGALGDAAMAADNSIVPPSQDPALAALLACDRALVAVGRRIKVLKAIDWPVELEERFLAAWRRGAPELPSPPTQPTCWPMKWPRSKG